MPPLDREPRPWPSSSSKHPGARSRPGPVFPSLKRVHRTTSSSGSSHTRMSRTEAKPALLETMTPGSPLVIPGGLLHDTATGISVLPDTDNQAPVESTVACGVDSQSTVVRIQDGQPLFPYPKPDTPPPDAPPPPPPPSSSAPDKESKGRSPLPPSAKKAPSLAVKASRDDKAQRVKKARSTEDVRIVQDSKKSAGELMPNVRSGRSEDKAGPRKIIQSKTVRETQKAATTRASIIKGENSSKALVSSKESSGTVRQGRTLERETSSKRALVLTESPKPHVKGKRSPLRNSEGVSGSSPAMKTKSATVPGRLQREAKTPPVVSKSKPANISKQRSIEHVKETKLVPRTRPLVKSEKTSDKAAAKRPSERKPIAGQPTRQRSSAPSSEELSSVPCDQTQNDGQDTIDQPLSCEKSSLREPTDRSSNDTTVHHQVLADVDQVLTDVGEHAFGSDSAQDESRNGSSSWGNPVYRPKTRRSQVRYEEQSQELSASENGGEARRDKLQDEDVNNPPVNSGVIEESEPRSRSPSVVVSSIPPDSHSAGVLQSRDNHSGNTAEVRGKVKEFDSSPSVYHNEHMSPIDPLKISSAQEDHSKGIRETTISEWNVNQQKPHYPWEFKRDIGGPLELGLTHPQDESNQDEPWKKPSPSLQRKKKGGDWRENPPSDAHLEAQYQSLLDFHSKTTAAHAILPVPFHNTLKSDSTPFEHQQNTTSPSGTEIAHRLAREVKHKRKGLKNVQWDNDPHIQSKSGVPMRVFLNDHQQETYRNPTRFPHGLHSENHMAENANSQDYRARVGGMADYPTYTGPQKTPLSCLTNSHRGQNLHVSFAPSPVNGLQANISADFDSNMIAQLRRFPAVRTGDTDHRHLNQSHSPDKSSWRKSDREQPHDSECKPGGDSIRSKEMELAKQGLQQAIATSHLLLGSRSSSDTSSKADDWFHGCVDFMVAVQKRFAQQPQVVNEFKRLLDTCGVDPISSDHAINLDAEIEKLFSGHPDLVEGYRRFRPPKSAKERSTATKSCTTHPMVVSSEIQENKQEEDGINSQWWRGKSTQNQKPKTWNGNPLSRRDSFNRSAHSLRETPGGNIKPLSNLVDSLKKSGQERDVLTSLKISSKSARNHPLSLRFNPEAKEFEPSTKFSTTRATLPSRSFKNRFNQTIPQQQQNNWPNSKPRTMLHRAIPIKGQQHPLRYQTMPTRASLFQEALKRDLVAAENEHPITLKTPITVNGTTYYSMPRSGMPVNSTTALPGQISPSHKKDCRFAFCSPVAPSKGSVAPFTTRIPRFTGPAQSEPVWMYTPLIPLRKENAGQSKKPAPPAANKSDGIEEHGVEVRRLENRIAKMKLDEFTSRFPMTGRKAQIVPNMKQKYAAEIQHRLELVLYEKKEREAAAKKLQAAKI